MLSGIFEGVKQLVFPSNCFLCRDHLADGSHSQVCPSCLGAILRNIPPFCFACSRHLTHYSVDGVCPSCRDLKRHYDRVWGTCLFDEEFGRLLYAFKYHGKTGLHKTFLPLLREFIDQYHVPLHQFDFVSPIALHPVRLRERGFNQSEILSAQICRAYQRVHQPALLCRVRPTQTQTHLDQKQRWTNLQGAFKIHPAFAAADVADKSILLVDDLLTTGATADAAAQCLKEAGAAHVGVLALAITPQ